MIHVRFRHICQDIFFVLKYIKRSIYAYIIGMKGKIMNKILRFLPVVALLAGVFGITATKTDSIRAEAVITSSDVRIIVVRPSWWETVSAHQVLRVAPTAADLTNNVVANITYYQLESYTADTYYTSGGGFTEYTTSGVVFYDVPFATITGKYVDLARLSTTDPLTASVWNKTGAEAFSTSLLHKVWRIWNDGNGIYRPEGSSAESRNVSNPVINSILYGYLSCSASETNGYAAFNTLNTNFNLTGRTFTGTDTVLDFTSETDYATGRGTGATVLTSDKVAMMQAMYNEYIAPARITTTLDFKKNAALITMIGLLGVSAIAGFYFFKTKKH